MRLYRDKTDGRSKRCSEYASVFSATLVIAFVACLSQCGFTSAADSQTTRNQLDPIVNRDSLTENNTAAAITVNYHFGNRTPSEEEMIQIYLETRRRIREELNRRRKRTTTVSTTTKTITRVTPTPDGLTTVTDGTTTATDGTTTVTVGTTTVTDGTTTVTEGTTTVTDDTTTTVTTVGGPEITEPHGTVIAQRKKKRNANDFGRQAESAVDEESIGIIQMLDDDDDDDSEDDEYTEEDLPFVNVPELFKDGVLHVSIFITNNRDSGSEPGGWKAVGDRLFEAETAVKEELIQLAALPDVTITRGLPGDEPTKKATVSASLQYGLPVVLAILIILCVLCSVIVMLIGRKHRNSRKKILLTLEECQTLQKIFGSTKKPWKSQMDTVEHRSLLI